MSTRVSHPHGALLACVLALLLAACDDGASKRQDAGPDADTDAAQDAGPDADADADLPEPDDHLRLAGGVTISKISLFQSVEVPFWRDGDPFAPAPVVVVPGRALRVAVWVAPGAGALAQATLRVSAVRAGVPTHLDRVVTLPAVMDPADPATAVFLDVPADHVAAGLSLSVRLLDADAAPVPEDQAHPARAGSLTAPLPVTVEPARAPVLLILIPVRYTRNGSTYLPDTSEAQLRLYRELLEATYPGAFELVLHDELPWSDPFTWSGNFDFGDLNDGLVDLKRDEGEPPESYYYALVAPASSFSSYCGGSCVTGQSYEVSNPASWDYRVGGGMGFTGENSAWTMVHELGHMFGRGHTGCDVSLDDRDYPYDGGWLGSWGLDPRTGTWIDPGDTADFMGYCDPTWVSDYTWNGLHGRIVALHQLYPPLAPGLPPEVAGVPVRLVHVNLEDGTWRAGRTILLQDHPGRAVHVVAGGIALDVPAVFQSGDRAFTLALPADLDADTLWLPEFPLVSGKL